MTAMWTCCAITLCSIVCLDAFACNFGDPDGLLRDNALVVCKMDVGSANLATAACPRRVNNTEYVWHPRPTADVEFHINAYLSHNGKFHSAAFSDVIRNESGRDIVWFESSRSRTELHFAMPSDELIAMTKRHLIFICGPSNMILSDALQSQLDRLHSSAEMLSLPWTPATPLTEEIAKLGKGIGVFLLYRGDTHLPLQGCGSRPSPLFAPDNEVTVDPVTGIRSCVADPMSRSPIGFVCEGNVEPENCMISLSGKNGDVVKTPRPRRFWKFENHEPWVLVRYFDDLALQPFTGECRCIDPETGTIKAKIEIRSKTEYVCDIARMIERNRASPISGPWCSVVLHPGSTLTIRFPTTDGDSASYDHSLPGPSSRQTSVYEYETEFLPRDLTTLRQLKTAYGFDVYEEISYNEALAGDALEMDVSQIAQGEVKLKYHADKPLALKGGHNSFLYHWRLKSTNEDVPDKIRAIVKLSFAFTHHYKIVGCDRGTPSLFDPEMSKEYCSTKWMGNGIGTTHECTYPRKPRIGWAGIHCKPDEELLPDSCESTGYDLSSNKAVPFPEFVHNVTPRPIPGFQVFYTDFQNIPLSRACICVDERGYEQSRLIIESKNPNNRSYGVRRENDSLTSHPYIWLPWSEAGLLGEGTRSTMSLVLHHEPQQAIKIHVGTKLSMTCAFDPGVKHIASSGVLRTAWLPKQSEEFYYTFNLAYGGTRLFRSRYRDSIAASADGFRVIHEDGHSPEQQRLIIESRRSAVLMSKNPRHKKYVPMTFVCGKAPQPSDLSVTDGSYASPSPYITGSLEQYTWHLVQVAVETTDPYMQGCGVTYESDEFFKPETPRLYDGDGNLQFGCKIDFQTAKEAAFYCPAPYLLDPPNCFSQVLLDGEVTNIGELSKSLVVSSSNHFVVLSFDSSLAGQGRTIRQAPPLECRCVTVKGVVLSTIQIENYYAK
ncbi:hypothetical protein, conserved [Babesia ovata]|uniref:6-Cys domain-containing protein n=1 Tax=Babesia ovata TaxID=189622 RepID=A0A2H6KFT7_9APIC|nr:uncharacterized protein BOVATA_033400 [Babesia ovata]GBE61847.1 hypothetical protein, conserved [Babesia ovata]